MMVLLRLEGKVSISGIDQILDQLSMITYRDGIPASIDQVA
jgi:hypothetical protein